MLQQTPATQGHNQQEKGPTVQTSSFDQRSGELHCKSAGDPHVGWNSGAGSQCEGEDFAKEVTLFDVATTHMYWR
jgi:hypothetical protein